MQTPDEIDRQLMMPVATECEISADCSAEAATSVCSPLKFKKITLAEIDRIAPMLRYAPGRTCDYTIGGIYMWIDWFRYEYCIYCDTLFIKGVSETDDLTPAFSLPLGRLSMAEAVGLLRRYCRREGITLRFSAIPDQMLPAFIAVGDWEVTPLPDWADYLYDIDSLATLSGKKMSKKRNHVNRFMADNPEARLLPLTPASVEKVRDAWFTWMDPSLSDAPIEMEERAMTLGVLSNLRAFPFEGAYLTDGRGNIVAFTVGEIAGDTLYVHIEKMNHDVAGAGEAINKLFAARMLELHPELRYVNREDDSGDPGLRRAKMSYNPVALLGKLEIVAH